MTEKVYADVVTRYGGVRHLAEGTEETEGRLYTLCNGTSSWTLRSWAEYPDHPLGLLSRDMQGLPRCTACTVIVAGDVVTTSSQSWIALITRRTVGGVEKAVGPFSTEEKAQHWLDSMKKPGCVMPLVVI